VKKQTGYLVGSATFFLTSILIFGLRFATSIVVARTLGVEGKGIYVLVLTVSSLLILGLNLGISGAFTYYTASQQFRPSDLFGFAVLLTLVISIIGGGLFWLAFRLFLQNTFLVGTLPSQIILVLISLPISLLMTYLASILLGLQQIVDYNAINLVNYGTNLLFQILSALLGGMVIGAILAWLASSVMALLVTLYLCRHFAALNLRSLRNIVRPAFSYGAKNYIANLLTFFNYRLDSFLVNFISGPFSVGLYTTGVTMAELLWYIPNSLSGALFPKVSNLEKNVATRITAQSCRQTLLVSLPLSVLFGAAGVYMIPFFYGAAFTPSVAPFLWLLPGILSMGVNKILSANLSGRGKPQYATYTSGITVIATIILDLTLIPTLGIVGAAIASSIAYTASAILSVIWFNHENQTNWRQVLLPTGADLVSLIEQIQRLLEQSIHKVQGAMKNSP
jgi:O-antigen/teichoic acid export membrane protein